MDDEEGDMSDYNTSEVDWGEEETELESDFQEEESRCGEEASQHSWERGDNCDVETWSDETDSKISCGDDIGREEDPEQEPPYLYHTTPRHPKPWISWNPSPWAIFHPTYKSKTRLYYYHGYKYFGPEFFLFSGFDYLPWEHNMDWYFEYRSTPRENKLSIVLGQLVGNALRWWDQEEYNRWYYNEPAIRTWEELKRVMRKRYSPHELLQQHQTSGNHRTMPICQTSTNGGEKGLKLETPLSFKEELNEISKSVEHLIAMMTRSYRPKDVKTSLGTQGDDKTRGKQPAIQTHLHQVIKDENNEPASLGTCEEDIEVEQKELVASHESSHTSLLVPKPISKQREQVISSLIFYDQNFQNTCMMHLSLPKIIDAGLGLSMDITTEEEFPKLVMHEPDQSSLQQTVWNTGHTLNTSLARSYPKIHGILSLIMIKEEPPDPFKHSPQSKTRGNLLNTHVLQWTNLVCLCVGKYVLRTKPLEEGGNDAVLDFETSTTNTWTTLSAHLWCTSKWNQPKLNSNKGVMVDTIRMVLNIPDIDRRTVNGGYRTDQKEFSYEVTCSRILTQQGFRESWNQVNSFCVSKVMIFPIRRILHLLHLDATGCGRLQSYVWDPGESPPY